MDACCMLLGCMMRDCMGATRARTRCYCRKNDIKVDNLKYVSPEFVEWMMGFRSGHTSLKPQRPGKDVVWVESNKKLPSACLFLYPAAPVVFCVSLLSGPT